MFSQWRYQRRVEQDLERWRAAGWLTEAGYAGIRADLRTARPGIGLAQSLSILAAVLIGFSVMSFVGANWEEMPRLARLGLLVGSLWVSYLGAGALFARSMSAFGHSAVLLGTALFGASIMLVSQMYHMDGNPPDAVLVWMAGTLLAGIALRSNPALAFAMVLASVWGVMETGQRNGVFWPYLAAWAAVAAAFYWQRWAPGVHLAGLTLTAFVVSLGYMLSGGHEHALVVLIGVVAAAIAVAGEQVRPALMPLWSGMLGYAVAIIFAGLWALQFAENTTDASFVLLAIITLIVMLGAIWWGLTFGHRGALWIGYLGFSAEILGIYAKKLGNLLDTSLFFLIAGLLVAALAYVAYRLHSGGAHPDRLPETV